MSGSRRRHRSHLSRRAGPDRRVAAFAGAPLDGRLAWLLWTVGIGTWLAGLGLVLYQRLAYPGTEHYGYWLEGGVNAPVLTTLGALLVVRRPRHRITRVFVLIVLAGGTQLLAGSYAHVSLLALDGQWPLGELAAWLATVAQMLVVVALVLMLWLFPTGRLPSRRWTPAAVVVGLGLAGAVVGAALAPGPLGSEIGRAVNPFGLGTAGGIVTRIEQASFVAVPIAILGGIAAPIVRFRRSTGEQRAQLKWFALAAVLAVNLAVWLPLLGSAGGTLGWTFGVLLLPIAVTVAILRYRLYEIDRVIGRTLAYALVTGVLLAVYALSVVALQTLLRPLAAESDLAVAGSTLAVAALFGPVRRRVQATVDRRFNRAQYDAAKAVESFGQRLRDEVDLDQVAAELRATTATTLAPASVSLWLADSPETAR